MGQGIHIEEVDMDEVALCSCLEDITQREERPSKLCSYISPGGDISKTLYKLRNSSETEHDKDH